MSRWPFLVPLLLLSACTMMRADRACLENGQCAARAAEPSVLRAAQGTAERRGDTLMLHPASGPTLSFTDRRDGCDTGPIENCHGYALMAFNAASHALVVENFLYEGGEIVLIDSGSGKQTVLNGLPTFSPDGGQFLVAPFDLENDAGPNNLELWRREGDGAVLVWAHPWKQEYVEDPALPLVYVTRVARWEPDSITLMLSMDGDPSRHWTGALTRGDDGWHLEAKSPPGLFPMRK